MATSSFPTSYKLNSNPFTNPVSHPPIPSFTVPGTTVNIPIGGSHTSSGSSSSPSLPQSSPTNITPAATSNQTAESIAAASRTAAQIVEAYNRLQSIKQAAIVTRQKDINTINQAVANQIGINAAQVTPVQFRKYSGVVVNQAFNAVTNEQVPAVAPIQNLSTIAKASGAPLRETAANYGLTLGSGEIHWEPYIKQEVIGSFQDQATGKVVPNIRYIYINPIPEGGGVQQERPATETEIKKAFFNKELASEKKLPVYKSALDTVQISYETLNNDLKEGATYPVAYGLDKVHAEDLYYATSAGNPYIAGFQKQIVQDMKENPLKNIALLGVGELLGLGYKGVSTGLSAIPKVGKILSPTFKVGATGYGIYEGGKVVSATSIAVSQAKNQEEIGRVLGETAKDVALLGYGFKGGEKGFDILKGEIRTRGLKELNVPQGEYPQASINKQLELFQKNIYKDISENPVAFHTTPEVFYKDKITPQAGTSELPGLYASTQVSTPFSQIEGSSSQTRASLTAFQQAVKEMFSAERNPGIAALEPKGFRYNKAVSTEPYQIGEQTFNYNFKAPAEKGVMDIPKLKTEIEAIARINAGEYEATGKKFYTKIKGVKVRIDAFKYAEEQLNTNLDTIGVKIKESFNKVKFKPEDYSSYREPKASSALPFSGISNSIQSSVSSMQSSIAKSLNSYAVGSSTNKSKSSSTSSANSSAISGSLSYNPYGVTSPSYNPSASPSQSSSGVSSKPSPAGSNSSSILPPSVVKEIISPKFYNLPGTQQKSKSLGAGYWVYGKQIKIGTMVKINSYPLTKSRAEDVGAYYVTQSLARTFVVKKTNQSAQEDYEFIYIPIGYFKSQEYKLRNYRIKNREPINFSDERFIQKAVYSLGTTAERKSLQEFRKQASQILGG